VPDKVAGFNQHRWLENRNAKEGIQFKQCSNAFLMRRARSPAISHPSSAQESASISVLAFGIATPALSAEEERWL
jgi:hypothetical protein